MKITTNNIRIPNGLFVGFLNYAGNTWDNVEVISYSHQENKKMHRSLYLIDFIANNQEFTFVLERKFGKTTRKEIINL